MLNYKIKMIFDFDENQYVVFIDGMNGIEGRGDTEQDAINDFNENFKKITSDNIIYKL